ncbi:hypothetical protein B5M42_015935 [Paenibacillus athensensis]|uniref:EF-hand domain-containing protein n=1 Tax=Paenibacillus athensensis TaxID=1967502 RepID=A0A4Y8QA77_9BACL|nr:hypothetical protein [Paenibacillus athensensis]MCD1260302.1 hypothetical protein [Paenibacillus athensensis]
MQFRQRSGNGDATPRTILEDEVLSVVYANFGFILFVLLTAKASRKEVGKLVPDGSEPDSFNRMLDRMRPSPGQAGSASSESALNALVRLGASSKAHGVELAQEWRSVIFQLSDSDGNGSVSRAELQQSVVAGGGTAEDADGLYALLNRYASSDAQDGELTVDSFRQNLAASSMDGGFTAVLANWLDANGDGEVSMDELDALLDTLRKAGKASRDTDVG